MNQNIIDIPENELNRNEIFLNLEELLIASILPTLNSEEGNVILQRFALYGEEEIEQ